MPEKIPKTRRDREDCPFRSDFAGERATAGPQRGNGRRVVNSPIPTVRPRLLYGRWYNSINSPSGTLHRMRIRQSVKIQG